MPAESGPPGRFRRAWQAFRHWRHTRPFLGGLLVTLGGAEILLSERAPLPLVIHIGLQGLAGYLVPIVILLCGLLLLFNPVQRTFYSLLAVLLSLASWITSNLGGFLVGMLLGVVGGGLAFAWTQRERRSPPQHRAKPRPVRTSGLALIRGDRREAGQQAGRDGGPQEPRPGIPGDADRGPDAGPSSLRAIIRPAPLTPIALSAVAAVAARGLMLAVTPASASAASPAVTPSIPWLPSPSPSPDDSPSRPYPSPRQPASPSPRPGHSRSARPGTPSAVPPRRLRATAPVAGLPGVPIAADKASLSARFAQLTGVSYDGITAVPTAHGVERMLKFSMESLRMPRIVLSVRQGAQSFLGTDSTLLLRGDVEFYTTRLSGVVGGIRVTFSPASPPSGLGKDVRLTSVVADQPFATADSVRAVGSTFSSRLAAARRRGGGDMASGTGREASGASAGEGRRKGPGRSRIERMTRLAGGSRSPARASRKRGGTRRCISTC